MHQLSVQPSAMAKYHKPQSRVHRGFFYLDDETVINSLSAVEAGKVDEVVEKINTARSGGFAAGIGGGVGPLRASIDGDKKSSSSFEEAMVRTRTRFSVFELWYQNLLEHKAIGTFDGWGDGVLTDVSPGDTIEVRAEIRIAPIHSLFRLYFWFAEQARTQGSMFSQKGEELKTTKDAERSMRALVGGDELLEISAVALPVGDDGPLVAMNLQDIWTIGQLGHLGGEYTLIAQVERVLEDTDDELPTMRLTRRAPVTKLEIDLLRESINGFIEPASALGVELPPDSVSIKAPAIWVSPIAIFR